MDPYERILAILAILSDQAQVDALPDVTPDGAEDDTVSVASLEAELMDLFDQVRAGDVELPDGVEQLETCRSIVNACQELGALAHLRNEAAEAERAAAEAEQAELDALSAQLHGGDDGGDGEGDGAGAGDGEGAGEGGGEGGEGNGDDDDEGDDGAGDGAGAVPEAVSAGSGGAAATRPRLGAAAARQPVRARPRGAQAPVRQEPTVLVASVNGGRLAPNENTGRVDRDQVAEVLRRGYREMGSNGGKRTLISVTPAEPLPEELHLHSDEGEANARKLDAIAASAQDTDWSKVAFTAGGLGWCTPSNVDYSEFTQALANRPATAALPSITVDHGGVKVAQNPTLSDINFVQDLADATHSIDPGDGTAITVFTEQNDIDVDPDDEATLKPVQKIDCITYNDFRTYAIVKRLRFDNFAARSNPEHVASFNDLAAAAFARVAETRILDLIKGDAGTTRMVDNNTILSSTRDFVELVLRMVESMRSAERATDGNGGGPAIRLMAPAWAMGMNQADLVRSPQFASGTNRLVVPRAELVGMLRDAGVNPSFYIDTPSTGPSQLLRKQTQGGTPSRWPCDVQFGLWFEGHFAHGTDGDLDIGVVRDRGLNEVNDYETFYESFETVVARRGPEALWITKRLSPDGSYAASVDASAEILADCS